MIFLQGVACRSIRFPDRWSRSTRLPDDSPACRRAAPYMSRRYGGGRRTACAAFAWNRSSWAAVDVPQLRPFTAFSRPCPAPILHRLLRAKFARLQPSIKLSTKSVSKRRRAGRSGLSVFDPLAYEALDEQQV